MRCEANANMNANMNANANANAMAMRCDAMAGGCGRTGDANDANEDG